jgi:hypothetical protein
MTAVGAKRPFAKPYGFESHKYDLQLMCNALISLGIKTRSFTAK